MTWRWNVLSCVLSDAGFPSFTNHTGVGCLLVCHRDGFHVLGGCILGVCPLHSPVEPFSTMNETCLALLYLAPAPVVTTPRTYGGGPVSGCEVWLKRGRKAESQRSRRSCSHPQSSLKGEGARGVGCQGASLCRGSHTSPLSPSRWSWLIAGDINGNIHVMKALCREWRVPLDPETFPPMAFIHA